MTTTPPRPPGFYWVTLHNPGGQPRLTVGEYEGKDDWSIVGSDALFHERDFVNIGPWIGSDTDGKPSMVESAFDEIDDGNDHCFWLAKEIDKAGGELLVRYKKMSKEERKRQRDETERARKRAQLDQLKRELGEK